MNILKWVNPFRYGVSDQCLGMRGPTNYIVVLGPNKANLCHYQVIGISWGLSVTTLDKKKIAPMGAVVRASPSYNIARRL